MQDEPTIRVDRELTQQDLDDRGMTLEQLAEVVADRYPASPRRSKEYPLPHYLEQLEAVLDEAYQQFASDTQLSLSLAGEWLLDNYYVIQEAMQEVREDMPKSYYLELPKVTGPTTAPTPPRVYMLAREIIYYSSSYLVFDQIEHFLDVYQQKVALTMGELWALPVMLRLGIIENLVHAVAFLRGIDVPTNDVFTARLTPEEQTEERTVSNCVLSLRGLAAQDWKEFFESVSRVEQVLRQDPSGVYSRMTFETRDQYRKIIEELAPDTAYDEEHVAASACRAAELGDPERPRTRHVGYYLLGQGRAQLETEIGYRPPWTTRFRRWAYRYPTFVYLGSIATVTLIALWIVLRYAVTHAETWPQLLAIGILGLIPSSALAVGLVNWVITRVVPPRLLPRMDFESGIPAEYPTMVAIPSLLSSLEEVDWLLQQLELHYLSNSDPNLYFALLTDFGDAPEKHMPGDEELLERLVAGIEALNEKYRDTRTSPFYCFHRERSWNAGEGVWMGWERKRGKLADLNNMILGRSPVYFSSQAGNLNDLPRIHYVITLDADTKLPQNDAWRLVATLAHPLNEAEFLPGTNQVVAGYTVLQPRVEILPTSANLSPFAQVFAGDATVDLYTRAVSDVYQDFFGEGIYAGKGIYDVESFEHSLEGLVPENTLLSHDLFEGIHGRAGLVSDISLFEDYPTHYLAYTRRNHRWIRGDWQLVPFLFRRVPAANGERVPNKLSIIDRWKILDNLRRSLVTPAVLALLIAGWAWLPGSPLAWTLIALLTSGTPVITSLLNQLFAIAAGVTLPVVAQSLRGDLLRWLFSLAFVAHETTLILDAVIRTLIRVLFTHRHLLEWTTAAQTLRLFSQSQGASMWWRQMIGAPIIASGAALLIAVFRPVALLAALPFLVAWFVSPLIASQVSRTIEHERIVLNEADRQRLRSLARRTWFFFEQYVTPDDHWLPPDHYQEDPRGILARHTSPTNTGMLLLATLGAYDMGYVGLLELSLRLRYTLQTLEQLERYRGHFLNWYDTRNLAPLTPRYVSTVDSGNLAASLLILRQGCLRIAQEHFPRWQSWEALLDAMDILSKTCARLNSEELRDTVSAIQDCIADIRRQVMDKRTAPEEWPDLLARLRQETWPELERSLSAVLDTGTERLSPDTLHELHVWLDRAQYQFITIRRDIDLVLPWAMPLRQLPPWLAAKESEDSDAGNAWREFKQHLPQTQSLASAPDTIREIRQRLNEFRERFCAESSEAQEWCDRLSKVLDNTETQAREIMESYLSIAETSEAYFQQMDFRFLYDRKRQVFHIGYNVDAGRMDRNYYDLLASEARIASFLTIAKGEVPPSHWLHLSRPFTQIGGTRVLLSWSATMFEYLMPGLLMRCTPNSLLQQSCAAVVQRQIEYGRQNAVPWGISESGYYRFDADMNYQYRAFGVPGLGFKRGLAEDLVIAPYASLLAVGADPHAVLDNLDRFEKEGVLGTFGLYEAIDYTTSRLAATQKYAIVRSYMSHHQGMIFLAILNYLQDDVMVQRFHADPRIEASELLLYEQAPRAAPVEFPHPEETQAALPTVARPTVAPWRVPMRTPTPRAHLLSNGRYTVVVTNAGGGYSQWQGKDITRWQADTTCDALGTFIYVEDLERYALWSAGYQPTCVTPESEETLFHSYKAEFIRRDRDISQRLEVTVSVDDDVEIRRLTLSNDSGRFRRLRVTSYAEVVLAARDAYHRHPAFNKLFVESEYLEDLNAILFRRRLREPDEEPVYVIHMLVLRRAAETKAFESDRASFLGRGQSLRSPAALGPRGSYLTGSAGATLDPIMSLGQVLDVRPHEIVELAFVTLAASSREEAISLAQRYQVWINVRRAFGRAWDYQRQLLLSSEIGSGQLQQISELLSALLYPSAAMRAERDVLADNVRGQPGLWPYAISGDYPILLMHVNNRDETDMVLELLRAHAYLRRRQVLVDLVIVNEQASGYADELHGILYRLITRSGGDAWLNRRGGIFVLHADQLTPDRRTLLATAARVLLDGKRGTVGEQLAKIWDQPARLPDFLTVPGTTIEEPTPGLEKPSNLLYDNGLGGFTPDGREYVIYLKRGEQTPAPWVNVIANPEFGFLVSESGMGFTWAVNSGENRLTPWPNDPVANRGGEALYLRDEETGHGWSPSPMPARDEEPYLIRHGAGYTVFHHHSRGLLQQLRLFAVPDAPVKVIRLELENVWQRPRRITATFYAEWVLGVNRELNQQYIVPEFDASSNALLARNAYNEEFAARIAFVAASQLPHGLTADRTEFLGREGSIDRPAALSRIGLSGTVRPGIDPCAAIQVHIELDPGERKSVFFLLGQGATREETIALIHRYQDTEQVEAAWKDVRDSWDRRLSTITVRTPDPSMDLLLNRWLPYQALSCRIWGRSGLYQSSGAFGFRDQLQDVSALLNIEPELAREHILNAARHQFDTGDVMHWWHPPSGRGVRTRYADDMLWLPFVTAEYVETTGDVSILHERLPFLHAEPLRPDENERYATYPAADETHTLFEHCRRAIEYGSTSGAHGLPLFRGGDWMDGFNRVGIGGKGESVWLGWFLYTVLHRFADIADRLDETRLATLWRNRASDLQQALNEHGWDGQWYLGGYYDDGTPLGSVQSPQCKIYVMTQSWAVLSGAGDPQRVRRAMESVYEWLVRERDGLLLIFTPPFDEPDHDPGYIRGYPPGIRENAGQYSHAAAWGVWAFAALRQGARAGALFRLMNPINHALDADHLQRYRVEPYVIAGDVYSRPPHVGRGGWTWYTGSAGWMYRLGIEGLLGLRRKGDVLEIDPCIPPDWPGFTASLWRNGTAYNISVQNPQGVECGVKRVTVDGQEIESNRVPLLQDGRRHEVVVELGE